MRAKAPAGVRPAGSDAQACAGASIVLSVNSAADAVDALRDSLPSLAPGAIWALRWGCGWTGRSSPAVAAWFVSGAVIAVLSYRGRGY
ncbi:hypothetical protein [Actinoplanes sp. NPDC049802]|uniref:hypothetical protein n=1 Tax=Actinoplanes sp. NPDC049802 TaxID=3154742 RepID=UPI0033FE2433